MGPFGTERQTLFLAMLVVTLRGALRDPSSTIPPLTLNDLLPGVVEEVPLKDREMSSEQCAMLQRILAPMAQKPKPESSNGDDS